MSRSPKSSPKKVHSLAVRLDAETKVGIEELAAADDRSVSEYIRRTLRQHVERELAKRKSQ